MKAAEAEDADAWERRLNVRKRARADALAGAPSAAAEDWSAAERDIIAMVDGIRQKLEAEREEIVQRLEADLRRQTPALPDIDLPIAEARLDLRQVKGRLGGEIATLHAQADQARRQVAGFREANGLARPAIYPPSTILQAALLMLAAAFEALFSATLFAETDERGLMGGAVIALGLSGANVTMGFLAGFLGLRYLGHARLSKKIAGALALAAAFGLALALNLFAAAWRNQISAAGGAIMDTLDSAALFGLTSPQAVILLMLGAGVWVFSALKGYSGFDDPYPDYGKLHRALRSHEEDLAEAREDAREDMEEAVTNARAYISRAVEEARSALAPMRMDYDNAAGRVADLELRIRRACDSGSALIQLYRRENASARIGAAPRYFAEPPPFTFPLGDSLSRAADVLLGAQKAVETVQARAAELANALGGELEETFAALENAPAREAA